MYYFPFYLKIFNFFFFYFLEILDIELSLIFLFTGTLFDAAAGRIISV